MSKTLEFTATSSQLPPLGFYYGVLTTIRDMGKSESQYGEQHQVRLEIRLHGVQALDDPDDEDVAEEYIDEDVFAYANLSFGPRSKLRRWASQILGREIEDGEQIPAEMLCGTDVRFQIGKNTVGNPTVKDIWKHKKARSKAKASRRRAPEPEPDEEFEGEILEDEEEGEDDF